MNTSSPARRHAVLVFLTAAITTPFVVTAALRSSEDSKLEPGFRWVSDGKTLNGWHKNPAKIGHGTGGRWVVEDGAISGEQDPPGSGNGGIMLTDEKFGDFEVIFETKPDWGVCSGFFLRSNDKGQCYQIMIDYHDAGNIGEIYREGLDGATNRTFQIDGEYADADKKALKSIKASPAPKNPKGAAGDTPLIQLADWPKLWRMNGWNTIRARVEGNPPTITTWLNGTLVTKYTSDKTFDDALGDRGSLAVQVHGGKGWPNGAKVRFRRIQVKELR
jgi:hypothetical protein